MVLTFDMLESHATRHNMLNIHLHATPLVLLTHITIHIFQIRINRILRAMVVLMNHPNQLTCLGHTNHSSAFQDTIKIKRNHLGFPLNTLLD